MANGSGWSINGKQASGIALGTHYLGSRLSDEESFRILDTYVALGGNVIDTARGYGESEACVGRWMASRKNREQIILMTKCVNPEITYTGTGSTVRHRLDPAEMESDIGQSLRALQTDHFDILYLHKDDPSVPAADAFDWLVPYREKGIAAEIGASNWTAARIAAANAYATQCGKKGFAFSELSFSLKDHVTAGWGEAELALEMDATEFAAYRANGLPVIGYSAQAYGFFFKPLTPDVSPKNRLLYDALHEIARKNGLSVHEALFGFYHGCGISETPLITGSTPERIREAMSGAKTILPAEDVRTLLRLRFGL